MEAASRPDPSRPSPSTAADDRDRLAGRVAELEALCADVLHAAAGALPPALRQRLQAALGAVEHSVADDLSLPEFPFPAAPGADADTGPELRPLPRRTVLVVDDDPMMLDVLARILGRENFELLMAPGGSEALGLLDERAVTVDLLITDYAMPGMQGRDLADRVRQRFPRLRVLYQTGFSDLLFDHCVELEDGAAFIEKPFTARGLREAVRLLLFGTLNPA